jgi:hypothetical protein
MKKKSPHFQKALSMCRCSRNKRGSIHVSTITGKLRKKRVQKRRMLEYLSSTDEPGGKKIEFPFISFENIVTATDNFSHCNMIGKGGFGKVYKVLYSKKFRLNIYTTENKILIPNDVIM